MKNFILTTILFGFLLNLQANTLSKQTKYEKINQTQEFQKNWSRELKIESWIKQGTTKKTINKVLKRIYSNNTLRDKTNEFKANHWTFEFVKEAEMIFRHASTYKQLREASTLYLIASYPNLTSEHETNALRMATDIYIHAEQLLGNYVKKIDMDGITGILHLPKAKLGNLPVILWTGGKDNPLVTQLHDIKQYLEKGYAVITFDMPGAGLNKDSSMNKEDEDTFFKKVYAYVKKGGDLFDCSRIVTLNSSNTGTSLIEFKTKKPGVKASVTKCKFKKEHLAQK